MKNSALSATSIAELESELDAQLSAEFKPNLAIVFASEHLIDWQIQRIFAERGIEVFGACSAEEISLDRVHQKSIACLLLELPATAMRLKTFEISEPGSATAAHDLGKTLAGFATQQYKNAVVLLLVAGGGIAIRVEQVLSGFFSIAPDMPVYGGLASSFALYERPPVFGESDLRETAVRALVLNRDIVDVHGIAVSGWRELGTTKKITRSEGNRVFEIEGMPATDFYRKYFDLRTVSSQSATNNIDPDLLAASEYPILLRRNNGSEVMRAAVLFDPETKSVTYGGDIPQGSLVRFCSPNLAETISKTKGEMEEFRTAQNLSDAGAVLLFNCAIRSRAFGPYLDNELAMVQRIWNAPVIGFNSWGEIGNTRGMRCDFHNTVISAVVLRKTGQGHSHTAASGGPAPMTEELFEAPVFDSTPEALRQEVTQLRREKRILTHFLHLTSRDLEQEKQRSEDLLLNILPQKIAGRLMAGETVIADHAPETSILFADLVGFTSLSAKLSAADLVAILNDLFSQFDELAVRYGVEKIKTIGDAYMAVAGLPEAAADHADRIVALARAMFAALDAVNVKHHSSLAMRIGINSGPVVAGVIGKRKFSYDLWGDSVNLAQRLESNGEPGAIQVSESTHRALSNRTGFVRRGPLQIKGYGEIYAWYAPAKT
ncbi:adenylate/guanylate cyclase domain-containing protein [Turneriella parva]|uniref:Adenylate/guanylate cyclase n=1 Tax=Turneriella parva (strain ATCC BAA-1111 / DSM 21527 / NCTC 11395 / H) TaxID=869212 RepID=I4B2M1_TURPD|nr:adenylate/guanylate cyclase domain-containing protein [Turneriella parva]AFM11528.1 adenylate/guanylate cyclase [Turneriella parva DSM 21527]